MSKFRCGEKVKIIKGVKYIEHIFDDDGVEISTEEKDWFPQIVGKEGVITNIRKMFGKYEYSIEGIPEMTSWYNEEQLKSIET